MGVIIINKIFSVSLYGFSGVAINRNWAETGFRLMNKMWEQVRSNNLKHKGINIWVYEENDQMFAGVELENIPHTDTGLELKKINLTKYAYYKHIGPYTQIGDIGSKMLNELAHRGIQTCFPYLEIYGHWNEDETKLETEMIWCLK